MDYSYSNDEIQLMADFIKTEADKTGQETIGLYERKLDEFSKNPKGLAALAIVVNHRMWHLYKTDEETARLYDHLWRRTNEYAFDNLPMEDQRVYAKLTD